MEKLYPWRIGAINEILGNCLVYATNIDKALKDHYKSSPKLGKKDRVFITEHSFNILRNLYKNDCTDLDEAIEKYFEAKGFDVSRIVASESGVSLNPNKFDSVFSTPNWVIGEFSRDNDKDVTEKVFHALNHRKQAFIRVNTNEISVEDLVSNLNEAGIVTTTNSESKNCLTVAEESTVALSQTDNYNRGYFEYQDLASQSLLEHILPFIGDANSILDLCAGEGGKSVQLAQLFPDADKYAYDIIADKTKRLKRRFDRFKNTKCPIILSSEELSEKGNFDFILIDAPCSGTGTFGRLPTQKYHLTEKHYIKMQSIQKQLLEDATSKVVDKGFIAYSTCSILRSENQTQIQDFLKENEDFTLIAEKQFLPSNEHDGLYVALLQKA